MADRPVIANLDFDSVKQDLIDHFKSREEFSDYEFTGSSLNLLMDILSYNTHYYSLASNFLLNESFLDSAILRKNVVSLAKSLNYVPRSVTSAKSTVRISFSKQSDTDRYVLIPAGTQFTASSGNSTISFYTLKQYTVIFDNTDAIGTVKQTDIEVKEGALRTQRFVAEENYKDFARFDLGQNDIDTTTLAVSVNGTKYQMVIPEDETLFELNSSSTAFFVEENRSGNPSVVFGNGIVGKSLSRSDEVVITYLASSGEDGNGISSLSVALSSRPDANIVSVSLSEGGAARESIRSIKDNAPKWFQAQYRAVTTNDYEVILKNKFADIRSINVFGGEDVGYPGKVFICIKPKSGDALSRSTKEFLKSEILSASNVATVRPEILDPKVFKVKLQTTVIYDGTRLATSREIIETRVKALFDYMNKNYIGEFLQSFRESILSEEIKKLDPSIVSSNSRTQMLATVKTTNRLFDTYTYAFNNKLYHPEDGFLDSKGGILSSSSFTRQGKNVISGFDDDGRGNVRLFDYIDNSKVYVNRKAGSIDYELGIIQFLYEVYPEANFELSVVTDSVDINAGQDVVLEIDVDGSSVEVLEMKETDLLRVLNLSRSF